MVKVMMVILVQPKEVELTELQQQQPYLQGRCGTLDAMVGQLQQDLKLAQGQVYSLRQAGRSLRDDLKVLFKPMFASLIWSSWACPKFVMFGVSEL